MSYPLPDDSDEVLPNVNTGLESLIKTDRLVTYERACRNANHHFEDTIL